MINGGGSHFHSCYSSDIQIFVIICSLSVAWLWFLFRTTVLTPYQSTRRHIARDWLPSPPLRELKMSNSVPRYIKSAGAILLFGSIPQCSSLFVWDCPAQRLMMHAPTTCNRNPPYDMAHSFCFVSHSFAARLTEARHGTTRHGTARSEPYELRTLSTNELPQNFVRFSLHLMTLF